jgi:hypothetical protein
MLRFGFRKYMVFRAARKNGAWRLEPRPFKTRSTQKTTVLLP